MKHKKDNELRPYRTLGLPLLALMLLLAITGIVITVILYYLFA